MKTKEDRHVAATCAKCGEALNRISAKHFPSRTARLGDLVKVEECWVNTEKIEC